MKISKLLPLLAFATAIAIISSCDKDNKEEENSYQPTTYADLSANGTANCYLISEVGGYKFKTVKGNTSVSVGNVAEASVLWESFGTDTKPNVGDLISSVSYKDGYIFFATRSTFAQGNAVIAAKDNNGTILWSWHIWCSTEGWTEQEYFNNAGTMMDRNLGALSAKPGDVGALGLFYQWGRKDPFLGSSSISSNTQAVSTGEWSLSSELITHDLCIKNPMTFYGLPTGAGENALPYNSWQCNKTEYDPCPAGWKTPDYEVWKKAFSLNDTDHVFYSHSFEFEFDEKNRGMDLGGKLGSAPHIWFPAAGLLSEEYEIFGYLLGYTGSYGAYWGVGIRPSYGDSYNREGTCLFRIDVNSIFVDGCRPYAGGTYSVRCLKEE